jgi:hypothetical protein
MKPQDMGTQMPVETHSDAFAVMVVGMGDSPKARNDANGKPKFAPNGEMTYGSGCIVRMLTKDGTIRNDKSASVHVTKPASIYELGQIYQAEGRVWVQPYESNGRVALSITVEALVPVKAETPGKAAA